MTEEERGNIIHRWTCIGLVILLGAVVFGCWVSTVKEAGAHSWYDLDCCSDEDCRPAKPGEIEATPEGVEALGVLFPEGDPRLRWSEDGDYHICISIYSGEILCVYRPRGLS